MNVRLAVCAAAAVFALVACATPEPVDHDGTWVGDITTEGDVTIVRNESGSVWGGKGEVIEELSIGVDAGDDPYMFGSVTGLWVTDDAIYVVDSRAPAVRVFDHEGRHVRDLGRVGQGPGEFERPYLVATDASGRVFIKEMGNTRVLVYTADGEYVDTWSYPATSRSGSGRMVLTPGGDLYIEHVEYARRGSDGFPDLDSRRTGMQQVGPDGKIGEMLEEPGFPQPEGLTYTTERGEYRGRVPFLPFGLATMAHTGAWISGHGAEYRFTIDHLDGSSTVVERHWDPVRLEPDERDAYQSHRLSSIRSQVPGWDWNGPPIPDHKPAFWRFHPGQDGQILVSRLGPGVRSTGDDCIEIPTPVDYANAREQGRSITGCWSDTRIWDLFAQDGRFLGEIDLPEARRYAITHRGRTLLFAEEDEAGVIYVRKYRIEPPA